MKIKTTFSVAIYHLFIYCCFDVRVGAFLSTLSKKNVHFNAQSLTKEKNQTFSNFCRSCFSRLSLSGDWKQTKNILSHPMQLTIKHKSNIPVFELFHFTCVLGQSYTGQVFYCCFFTVLHQAAEGTAPCGNSRAADGLLCLFLLKMISVYQKQVLIKTMQFPQPVIPLKEGIYLSLFIHQSVLCKIMRFIYA